MCKFSLLEVRLFLPCAVTNGFVQVLTALAIMDFWPRKEERATVREARLAFTGAIMAGVAMACILID